jgi:hypothetical protein
MKIARTPSMIALAIYLILIGLSGLFGIRWGVLSPLVPISALAAGVLMLAGK